MQFLLSPMFSGRILMLFAALMLLQIHLISGVVYYKDCGSRDGHLDSLTVSGCEMQPSKHRGAIDDRCSFKRGSNVTLYAQFTPGNLR